MRLRFNITLALKQFFVLVDTTRRVDDACEFEVDGHGLTKARRRRQAEGDDDRKQKSHWRKPIVLCQTPTVTGILVPTQAIFCCDWCNGPQILVNIFVMFLGPRRGDGRDAKRRYQKGS